MLFGSDEVGLWNEQGLFLLKWGFEGLNLEKQFDLQSFPVVELDQVFALQFLPVNFLYFFLFSDFSEQLCILLEKFVISFLEPEKLLMCFFGVGYFILNDVKSRPSATE